MSRAEGTKGHTPNRIIALDCGSTTTKVALLLLGAHGKYHIAGYSEAPTTVEAPYEDVTYGVRSAVEGLEEATGLTLMDGLPRSGQQSGTSASDDLFIATSSAGGGLQMTVAGVIGAITAESAQRAALGAGAVVTGVISVDDGRHPYQRIDKIRQLRPDIVLISGGIDGGNISQVLGLGELFFLAAAKPRFGQSRGIPIVFAGNEDAAPLLEQILSPVTEFRVVENLRPRLEEENLLPATSAIQQIFMNHVMAHAPNYLGLQHLVDEGIMPTPGAAGQAMLMIAEEVKGVLVGVDIGGATTDVFSVVDRTLHRSVSANLGMSYSAANVVKQAGESSVSRWLPSVGTVNLHNGVANKMIRPALVPETWEDLALEHALAREALRLSLESHNKMIVGLKGVPRHRRLDDIFNQGVEQGPLLDMMKVNSIIGSGGVLAHAPDRRQVASILIDSLQPMGFTDIYAETQYLLPQLGLLAQSRPEAARQILFDEVLVQLATCLTPVPERTALQAGDASVSILDLVVECDTGRRQRLRALGANQLFVVALTDGPATVTVTPMTGWDVGAGPGRPIKERLNESELGLIVDTRGRPLTIALDPSSRRRQLLRWWSSLGVYPDQVLSAWEEGGHGV